MKFLILILLFVVLIAGCTSSQSVYRNEVLVQDDYVVTRTNPFTDSTTGIRFYLKNYGKDTVPKAVVNFFNLEGLTVSSLICQGGSNVNDHTCEFSNIPSNASRYVSLTLNTPSSKIVKAQTDFQINYKISFDYSGFRKITIPVIDDMQERQPKNKYSVSDPSVGPILVDFEPPLGATTTQGNQQVQEYWGVKGDSLEVRMNFRQVVPTNILTNIGGNNIRLKLDGLNIDSKSNCDFNSDLTAKDTISVGQSSTSLSCSFVSNTFSTAEIYANIDVNYAYTFETLKTVIITVTPRQTSEGGSNTEGSNEGGRTV